MEEYVTVARVDDVPVGEARAFDVGGTVVAVARTEDAWYGIDDTCTHRQCSLAEGEIDDGIVTCPCHGSEFALSTGEVMNGPADEPVRTFEVLVEGEEVRVRA
jgi:3-phenylpropionate/trans-cinnamate dioxygenase ferredoxin component